MTRTQLVGLAGLALAAVTTGCAATPPASVALPADAVVIDVRTAREFASGHLDGAVLLDVSNGDLAAALPLLDPDAPYFVHCRSGSRSAQAVALMREAGFADVTDLGALESASAATGLAIER
ncbi:rhodanese-like domain-containing protein [Agrococcus sp. ARC_14]|uniref:rhodanese-like domain-containing protein n=1 Tax=unclassified Agrococcus TaxID=2615065 RepID=UPI001F051B8A|nr:rhodanese-like domain-containing protein [Agrococcus sp. ARC_14]MCH1882827.1 rhodanese-like domain-containing protein [Agrococcus sp. ARC_14]